jgi:hypothetical protein
MRKSIELPCSNFVKTDVIEVVFLNKMILKFRCSNKAKGREVVVYVYISTFHPSEYKDKCHLEYDNLLPQNITIYLYD